MGLDMNLIGKRRMHINDNQFYPSNSKIDKRSEEYYLGYWRKHHNLHDYIIDKINDGVDGYNYCIDLSEDDLIKILSAIKNGELPPYFPDINAEEQKKKDIEIVQQTIDWLSEKDLEAERSVYYDYCH